MCQASLHSLASQKWFSFSGTHSLIFLCFLWFALFPYVLLVFCLLLTFMLLALSVLDTLCILVTSDHLGVISQFSSQRTLALPRPKQNNKVSQPTNQPTPFLLASFDFEITLFLLLNMYHYLNYLISGLIAYMSSVLYRSSMSSALFSTLRTRLTCQRTTVNIC